MMADELLSGAVVDAFVMGNDAPDHSQLARANTLYSMRITPVPPVVPPDTPPDDQPRLVGDLAASAIPRGYGIAFTLARNAWRKVIEGETA